MLAYYIQMAPAATSLAVRDLKPAILFSCSSGYEGSGVRVSPGDSQAIRRKEDGVGRLSTVKEITRRWTPGHSFQEAGAALVSSCRVHLSDSISIKWIKGQPERSELAPSAWSRRLWGIYIAVALSKQRDLGLPLAFSDTHDTDPPLPSP